MKPSDGRFSQSLWMAASANEGPISQCDCGHSQVLKYPQACQRLSCFSKLLLKTPWGCLKGYPGWIKEVGSPRSCLLKMTQKGKGWTTRRAQVSKVHADRVTWALGWGMLYTFGHYQVEDHSPKGVVRSLEKSLGSQGWNMLIAQLKQAFLHKLLKSQAHLKMLYLNTSMFAYTHR